MIILPFNYCGNKYSALVNEKYFDNKKEYRITIMNGELEQLLYGHHVLIEEDGIIKSTGAPADKKEKLIAEITNSLSDYMEKHNVF